MSESRDSGGEEEKTFEEQKTLGETEYKYPADEGRAGKERGVQNFAAEIKRDEH